MQQLLRSWLYLTHLKYGNKDLRKLDIFEGDNVCFLPESEYEFEIEGETLYRMKTKDICVLI